MAIVINGSGTVTGISVGGLPDDIVDSGTLADDAVIAANLATDSVTADALEVSAIAVGDLPAGCVLKVQRSATGAETASTSTSYAEVLTFNYTPVSTNSIIYAQVFVVTYNNNTNTTAGLITEVRRAGVNIGIADRTAVYTSSSADHFQAATTFTGEYTNSATDAADFEFWMKSYDGGAVKVYLPYMIITEVAG